MFASEEAALLAQSQEYYYNSSTAHRLRRQANEIREDFNRMPYNDKIIELEEEVAYLNRIWGRGTLGIITGVTLLILGSLGLWGLGLLFILLGAPLLLGSVIAPPIMQSHLFARNPRVELAKEKRREIARVTKEYMP